jgi:hypothetical protein
MYYELRTYTAAPGKMDALLKRFRDHTIALFGKHDIKVVGFWTSDVAGNDELVYLLAYPDQASSKTYWEAFQKDPQWIQAKSATEVNGKLAANVGSKHLIPTDFSPLQ